MLPAVLRRLFGADLGEKTPSAGAAGGWIDGGGRSSGHVAHVAFDVQGEHLEVHREGDPWSAAHAQLGEAMASLQFRVRGLDARSDLVLLFELRCCLLLSSLSDCHVGNFEREDAPVAATLDRTHR